MTGIFAIVGFIIGCTSGRLNFSVIVGWTCMGWMFGSYLKSRGSKGAVETLQEELEQLRLRVRALEVDDSPPSVKSKKPSESVRDKTPEPPVKPPEKAHSPESSKPPLGFEPPPLAKRPAPTRAPKFEPPDIPFEPNVLASAVRTFFTTGNLFAKVGAILLFFGVAFLIKFVSEIGLFPIEGRLIACAVGANLLIALGWKLRNSRRGYALILQGVGFGILFLTIFGAYHQWKLLPSELALGLLVAATVLFSLLAVLQDSLALACLAVTGGFSAPVLISTGSANHVALFSYYALLNVGVFCIAWSKAWRELNLIAFLFTYGVGGIWGAKFYTPENFETVEPFLIFHFLLYVAVAMLFSKLQFKMSKALAIDGTLVFGVPIATFAMQGAMLKDTRYGIAISAAALGVFYISLAAVLFRRGKKNINALVESFLSSGLMFNTLAVPFALSHTWTAATWAVEGAFLVWNGARQGRSVMRYFGFGLQVLAYSAFFFKPMDLAALDPIFNAVFVGSLVLFFSALFIGYQMHKKAAVFGEGESKFLWLFLTFGFLWWCFALYQEAEVSIRHYYSSDIQQIAALVGNFRILLLSLSVLVFHFFARLIAWPALGLFRYALFASPVLFLQSASHGRLDSFEPFTNPFYIGLALLSLASLVSAGSLFKLEKSQERWIGWAFLLGGYSFWIHGNWTEFSAAVGYWYQPTGEGAMTSASVFRSVILVVMSISALLFQLAARVFRVPELGAFRFALTAFGAGYLTWQYFEQKTPFQDLGSIAWVVLFGTHNVLLMWNEPEGKPINRYQHFTALWLFTALFAWFGFQYCNLYISAEGVWKDVYLLGIPGVIVTAVILWPAKLFPVGRDKKAYLTYGLLPHIVILTLGSQYLNLTSAGNPSPLAYYPVANPLGVAVGFCLLVLAYWYRAARGSKLAGDGQAFAAMLGFLVFLWLTMGLIRTLHYYVGIPWDLSSILSSRQVQTGLSIFWGMLGLMTMVVGHRKGLRYLWIFGCCLMSIVVVKLFAIDLKEKGTLERIISFIGTGVLLLLTGYFAPIPPTTKRSTNETD